MEKEGDRQIYCQRAADTFCQIINAYLQSHAGDLAVVPAVLRAIYTLPVYVYFLCRCTFPPSIHRYGKKIAIKLNIKFHINIKL